MENKDDEELFREFDLANGTFVEKIPTIVRWFLFLPASIFGSLIAVFILGILNFISMSYLGATEDGWSWQLFQLLQSFLLGLFFVLFGATVIPKWQFITSIFLLVVATLIGLVAFAGLVTGGQYSVFMSLFHGVLVIVGGGYAVYLAHKAENGENIWNS